MVWGVLDRREMWRCRPKSKTAASAVSRRLKLQETQSAISAEHKAVEYGLRVDVCGPLSIVAQMVSRD